jgi:hypothetical protein
MPNNPEKSERYIFITQILPKCNGDYTPEQVKQLLVAKMPRYVDWKGNEREFCKNYFLFLYILDNLEKIQDLIKKYYPRDSLPKSKFMLSVLVCCVGQIIAPSQSRPTKYISKSALERLQQKYRSYIEYTLPGNNLAYCNNLCTTTNLVFANHCQKKDNLTQKIKKILFKN